MYILTILLSTVVLYNGFKTMYSIHLFASKAVHGQAISYLCSEVINSSISTDSTAYVNELKAVSLP